MMRNITIILIVLIIAGCAFSEEYPDEWADLAQSPDERIGSCPAIEGVYQDKSTIGDNPLFASQSLANMLHSALNGTTSIDATTVEISQPSESTILVTPSGLDGFYLSADEGHFSCEDGAIDLGSHGMFGGDGYSLGGGSTSYYLYKSEDNELILQEKTFVAGVFIIIPIAGFIMDWVAKWKPTFGICHRGSTDIPHPQLVMDINKLSQFNEIVDQAESVRFYTPVSLDYSLLEVSTKCFRDMLIFTDQHIYAVWNWDAKPMAANCPAIDTRPNKELAYVERFSYSDILAVDHREEAGTNALLRIDYLDESQGGSSEPAERSFFIYPQANSGKDLIYQHLCSG